MRLIARNPGFGGTPKAFVSHPEPRSIGNFARGQQMLVGNFRFGGSVIEAPDRSIWELLAEEEVIAEIQSCSWIDDIATTGQPGRRTMQAWVADWIRRYGNGSGPGWQADLTGQRLIRWISHAIPLMQGQDKSSNGAFLRSIARQATFLSRTWRSAPKGLPRLQALTGMIYASLALEGMERQLKRTITALGEECDAAIDPDGGIVSRSPEELLEILTLLAWSANVLTEAEHTPDRRHRAAIDRIAPTLRTLMLSDGTLVRFHGGGRGEEGQADHALAEANVRTPAPKNVRMGYARLAAGRTIAIVDCAAPAEGPQSETAHASTLSFELSTGRLPLIVNSGPGRYFGERWRRAARATGCHSTLVIADTSSATIWDEGFTGDTFGERLYNAPGTTKVVREDDHDGCRVLVSHDGYVSRFGLTHDRALALAPTGREMRGEDRLKIADPAHKRAYDRAQRQPEEVGLSFTLHFHLHPDVDASLDLGGNAVSMKLRNDEVWVFRQSGGLIAIEDGVYLDQSHLRPRMTKQIVVHGLTEDASATIAWTLTRSQDGRRYTEEDAVEALLQT